MSRSSSGNPSALARGVSVLIVQALVSAVIGYLVFLQTFRVAGCDESCRYDVLDAAIQAQLWVAGSVFVASMLAVIGLSMRGRESWWVPAIGVVIVVLCGAGTALAIITATAP